MSVRVSTLASGLRVVTDAAAHLKTASLGLYFGAGFETVFAFDPREVLPALKEIAKCVGDASTRRVE